ncbi:MAG: GntR family transcriptional regulator, partial [Paenibacillus sp.]|nr:GntR family transcriptional regulator [Paenibacillus sp.]
TREQAFHALTGGTGEIHTIPWEGNVEAETAQLLGRLEREERMPAGILCCNGPIGLAAAQYMRDRSRADLLISAIDYMPEMSGYPIITYKQPMKQLAEKSYERLLLQNEQGELWQSCTIQLQGEIVRLNL